MSERPFRSRESYEAEEHTRQILRPYLQHRGFVVENDIREHQGQTIVAVSPNGEHIAMRVRLCWRQRADAPEASYAAAQLLARIKNDDWEGTIKAKVERERSRGVSHFLFVQRSNRDIDRAALVPINELLKIWTAQRDVSTRLIREGKLGARKKNHAMNGTSPTIWLRDDHGGEEVASVLWNHPGVIDIDGLPLVEAHAIPLPEEVVEPATYAEGTCKRIWVNSYERDMKARSRCIEHYGTTCCICDFDFAAVYGEMGRGYIHVHHLRPLASIGHEYVVDPIKDMRPICPNCHAVVHAGGQCRDIEEIRRLISDQRHRREQQRA